MLNEVYFKTGMNPQDDCEEQLVVARQQSTSVCVCVCVCARMCVGNLGIIKGY